ncbi:PepSY-associated TM helix domain-containing protein [Ferrimonas sp. YFM]|uniref:PepSY-associated TM helix domain-containing protein n=1 Tax=Ferrimonas sp. YFM TaxID=3028878 RepID=UPI002572F93F|nr:PepSY-associated TM helix domain-containing protein [Ferrimonas sp. YFM]BDY06286.1 peptidase [Ferrimonas sp. YFM]
MAISWYRLNRNLHRDIGYFCIGLTIVFAVSGIAVNHNGDWNPNYVVAKDTIEVSNVSWDQQDDQHLTDQVMAQVDTDQPVKAIYWAAPNEFKVFLKDASNLSLNLEQNTIVFEHIKERAVFKEFNRLHLNEGHSSWVIFSDLYAGLLLFLALSALFMVKGKHSPWRRKSIYLIGGILVPLVFIFL